MRRQNGSRLRMWAREVRQHLTHDDRPVAYLAYDGESGTAPTRAQAEDLPGVHPLDLVEVGPDGDIQLGQVLLQEGVKEVTVTIDGIPAQEGESQVPPGSFDSSSAGPTGGVV